MISLVALATFILVIAGVGSLILTSYSDRQQATQQLITEADSLTVGLTPRQSSVVLKAFRRGIRLENAYFVRITALGSVTPQLPQGVDVNAADLISGETASGHIGNLLYVVAPVTLTAGAERFAGQGRIAVVLTRQVGDLDPSWRYLIIASGAALLVAALLALRLSRRMSRPLIDAMKATKSIASGDFQGRVAARDRDYPEFSSLADSINVMAESLADGKMRERRFLLTVSHDLRTPLTSIKGFAEAIADGAVDDPHSAAEVIVTESNRLERLVHDLLDLARLEVHQMSISIRPTDGPRVVRMAVERLRPLADKMGLNLLLELPTQAMPELAVDPDRLDQIISNLIENAITFARSNVTVTLSDISTTDTRFISRIAVQNDGPEIPWTDLPKVFDRFYQGDRGPVRTVGSGLGLAVVAELADLMGTTVRAKSPVDYEGGSRFIVDVLPWLGPTDNAPADR